MFVDVFFRLLDMVNLDFEGSSMYDKYTDVCVCQKIFFVICDAQMIELFILGIWRELVHFEHIGLSQSLGLVGPNTVMHALNSYFLLKTVQLWRNEGFLPRSMKLPHHIYVISIFFFWGGVRSVK